MVNIKFWDGNPPISEEREGIGLVQNRVFMGGPIGMIKKKCNKRRWRERILKTG